MSRREKASGEKKKWRGTFWRRPPPPPPRLASSAPSELGRQILEKTQPQQPLCSITERDVQIRKEADRYEQ